MTNRLVAWAAFASAICFAQPASATLTLGGTPCASGDISPAATACLGWYEGNLNGGSPGMLDDSAAALNSLLGTSTFSGSTLTWVEGLNLSGNTVNFGAALYGDTVVSFHVGAANGEPTGVGYQSTAFYRFDAGNAPGGLDTFSFNRAGLSNARLYYTSPAAVPEPATWALMLLGFGIIGSALRRKASVRPRFA